MALLAPITTSDTAPAVVENREMEDEFPSLNFRSFNDRYFSIRYKMSSTPDGGDYRIMLHSNNMIVVMLASSHPIVKEKLTVLKVNYHEVTDNNFIEVPGQVSGKRKRGARILSQKSKVCTIECAGAKIFEVHSEVGGKLLEVNKALSLAINSGSSSSMSENDYLFIIDPRIGFFEKQFEALHDQGGYELLKSSETRSNAN